MSERRPRWTSELVWRGCGACQVKMNDKCRMMADKIQAYLLFLGTWYEVEDEVLVTAPTAEISRLNVATHCEGLMEDRCSDGC